MSSQKHKTAFVFPGQGSGSVKPGMGLDIFRRSEAARKVIWAADYQLRRPFSHLCFFGSEEELAKTVNAQLASFIMNMAYVAAYEEAQRNENRIVRPDYLAGHSVGLIAAMAYAGVFTFSMGLLIVQKRSEFMAEACQQNPGKMVVPLRPKDPAAIEELMRNLGLGGNVNSKDQIVLSGSLAAISEAERIIDEDKLAAGCLSLRGVEGAFHSDQMKPAGDRFVRYLSVINFNDPRISIISNVDPIMLITDADKAKQELGDHICSPVLWHQGMEFLREKLGVRTFVEAGHGVALSNNLKRDNNTGGRNMVRVRNAGPYIARRLLSHLKRRRAKTAS